MHRVSYDGMYCGMAIMTHRTTFALDQVTADRIRALAHEWGVSQAEVIRRVIAEAAEPEAPDPIAALDALHASGQGLSPQFAADFLSDVRRDRARWRSE